jgi:hypothetical protein
MNTWNSKQQKKQKLISKQKKEAKPSIDKPQITQTNKNRITFTYHSPLIRK